MNIKKRGGYAILGLLILIIGIFTINASIMHLGHDFELSVDGGNDVTLQDAMDDFSGSHTYALPSTIPDPGHSFDEIWVSVNGNEKTLQDALSTFNGLCGSSSIPYLGPTDPNDLSKAYHYADEIEISSEKTLQDAINSGDFCCVPDCSCATTTCVGSTCLDGCGGTCAGTLAPDCTGRECGAALNGCGGANACGTCGLHTTCPSGTCVCDTGWGDCNNDNTCDCDLSSNYCGGRPSRCIAYIYSWYQSAWSGNCIMYACSGTSTRTVYCQDQNGVQVDDDLCSGTKPYTVKSCYCTWSWGDYLGCKVTLRRKCSLFIGEPCTPSGETKICKGNACAPFKAYLYEIYCQSHVSYSYY